MHWEHRSMVGYSGWQLSFGECVKNTRHRLLPTVGVINRSNLTAWNVQTQELTHKSLRLISADCDMCAVVIVRYTNRCTFLTTIPLCSGWPTIFNTRPCREPGAMTNTLPDSLWFLASLLFMGLIAPSSSSLGDEMFELLLGHKHWCCAGELSLAGRGQKDEKARK